jgi:mediator of RNA polymerase II transcription subunit 13
VTGTILVPPFYSHFCSVKANDYNTNEGLLVMPLFCRGNVKFKAGSLIRDTLDRLWQFITGVLSTGCRNWRLVIGRVGRLGHGELKGMLALDCVSRTPSIAAWAQMLGRPNLKRYSQTLKEHCGQCQLMPGFHETPSLLSACLVSIEPEPSVRVFSTSVTHDDRALGVKPAKHRPLRTPEDASCTHILVYPTSAFLSAVRVRRSLGRC